MASRGLLERLSDVSVEDAAMACASDRLPLVPILPDQQLESAQSRRVREARKWLNETQ